MPLAIIGLIEALISAAPAAVKAWGTLKPILAQGRDPTPAEWASLNADMDAMHTEVQG
jgi:hypothetical protein